MVQLYDYANRPIKPPSRPETREIGAVSIRDRWSSYPSRGLTPQRLAAIFRAADAGDLRSQAELFTEMKQKDTHLYSVLGTRRLAALGLEWQVEDASEDPQDKKIAEFCRDQLKNLKLKALMKHLLGAVGHGYAAAEILWQTGAAQWTIRGFNFTHPKNITFLNSPAPLVITEDNSQGVEPQPFQLAFHQYEAESGYDTPTGVLRVCAWMFLFKNYSVKDWVVFCELFGMPLRLGKFEPSATPADREALRLAISMLGTDAAGIISKSTEIEFVEAATRLSGTTNPYEVLANFCNREMSKAVLGQTLTTDSSPGSGTLAGNAHENVRQDLLEADTEALAETIREQVLRPLVGFNFGWDAPVPGFSLPIQDSPDLQSDSVMVGNLVKAGGGKRIPAKWINEHFGIPEPEKDEETLEAPPSNPQPPGGPGQPSGGPAEKASAPPEGLKAVLTLREGKLELIPQDRQVIQTQQELEDLTQAAMDASALVVAGMLKPVNDLIKSGASLEAVRDGLLAVYPEMPADSLGELLYQARMLAYMKARVENG